VVLDALDLVHALVTQIPDAGKHRARSFGAYGHRAHGRVRRAAAAATCVQAATKMRGAYSTSTSARWPGAFVKRRSRVTKGQRSSSASAM